MKSPNIYFGNFGRSRAMIRCLMWQYFKGENKVIWEVDVVKSRRPVDPGCVSYSQVRNELAANDWPPGSRI